MAVCSWQGALLCLLGSAALVAAPDLLEVLVHWRQEEREFHDDCDERGIQSILQERKPRLSHKQCRNAI